MWILFAVLAAVLAATSVTLTKAGIGNVDPILAFAIQSIYIIIITWVVLFAQKGPVNFAQIDRKGWLLISLAGVATCLSSIFQFKALKLGNASVVTSIERSSLAFAILFAFFFLKEHLNWKILVGAAMIIGGALIIALSSKK